MDRSALLLSRYLREGDQQAFRELHELHGRVVRSFARRVAGITLGQGETPEKARLDAITQEIWATVARKAEDFDPARASFRSWVLGIARNVALRVSRDQARHAEQAEPLARDPRDRHREPDPAWLGALRVDLANAMEFLDDLEGKAFVWKHVDELTNRQIAERLGVSESTVVFRLNKAMLTLRPLMRGWGRNVRDP
jgi:RNA polymerase sigma-70 factor (ECF subfamily)